MSLSDAEIEALTAGVQDVSSTQKLLARPALKSLLNLINTSVNISPVTAAELLRGWLSRIHSAEGLVKINARDATISEITEVFGLKFDKVYAAKNRWTLAKDSLLDVPLVLRQNLDDLQEALYDEESEATCRIAIDIMLVQCRKYLRHKHQSAKTSHSPKANIAHTTNPSTPRKAEVDMLAETPTKPVKLFPEPTVSVEIQNRSVGKKFLVSGRADWALGYSSVGDDGSLLIAIEAKQRSDFSRGEAQLIAYLAILRENRRRTRKTNVITQGFYSDGARFAFICITADGTIEQSSIFDIDEKGGLRMVFSFIVTMMETAMKSTPNATPTKAGELQEKEIHHFTDEVWSKVYASMDESVVVCSDDDMDDAVDVS